MKFEDFEEKLKAEWDGGVNMFMPVPGDMQGSYNIGLENTKTGDCTETQGDLLPGRTFMDLWNWLVEDTKENDTVYDGNLDNIVIMYIHYAGTDNIDPEEIASEDNSLAEFKGQVVDIIEDYLEANDITFTNPEKEEYDKEAGYGPGENGAIIFGSDYDIIADEIEMLLVKDGKLEKIKDEDVRHICSDIVGTLSSQILWPRAKVFLLKENADELIEKLSDLLRVWDIVEEG